MATELEIIKDLIDSDIKSKRKIDMRTGINYFDGYHDILKRDFREYYVKGFKNIDYNKSNDCLVNNFHKKLVNQKSGYVAGKNVVITSEDKELETKVNELLGEDWHDTILKLVTGASKKGSESLQPFINSNGEFDYTVINDEQLIYITDTVREKEVMEVVRYYDMEVVAKSGEVEKRKRVEVWDIEKVTRYQENDNEEYFLIEPNTEGIGANPEYHWYTYNTVKTYDVVTKQGMEGHGWGKVPFARLINNDDYESDLMPVKRYIDALDLVSSGFLNDINDIQEVIWVLRGYEGQGLEEFMTNLKQFKAISLSGDADTNSSAEPKSIEIPEKARVTMMEWIEKKIYQVGEGVDLSNISGGSITNVMIKALYNDLDLKSDRMIVKAKKTLSDFMYFVVDFINRRDNTTYNYKELKFTFNKSTIFNVSEIVDTLVKLQGVISQETLLSNIPFIDNVELELEKLEKQREKEIQVYQFELNRGEVNDNQE